MHLRLPTAAKDACTVCPPFGTQLLVSRNLGKKITEFRGDKVFRNLGIILPQNYQPVVTRLEKIVKDNNPCSRWESCSTELLAFRHNVDLPPPLL
jgi:hypothetical protein